VGKGTDRDNIRGAKSHCYEDVEDQWQHLQTGEVKGVMKYDAPMPFFPNSPEDTSRKFDQNGREIIKNAPSTPHKLSLDNLSLSPHSDTVQQARSTPYPSKKISFADFIQRVLNESDRNGVPESTDGDTNDFRREQPSAQLEKTGETKGNLVGMSLFCPASSDSVEQSKP
jgi:hypothetical protein